MPAHGEDEQRAEGAEPGRGPGVGAEEGRMMFWICGVPGSASMVKENAPRAMVAGINRLGMSLWRNISAANG